MAECGRTMEVAHVLPQGHLLRKRVDAAWWTHTEMLGRCQQVEINLEEG
jgi:hypothetical protein